MEGRKVLIADDEAHIIYVVKMKLQKGGFDVVTAMDGQEALDLARQIEPCMLVTDLQMPVMSGLEVAAALYRDEKTRHIPVLLLTAKGFEVDEQVTADTNVRLVMTKPFSPRDLLARVNEVLDAVAVN
jgi:CheY-like chemotaxis protein